MNWKKKLLALGLSLALTLSLTACGQKAAEPEQPEEPAQTEEPAAEAPEYFELFHVAVVHFRLHHAGDVRHQRLVRQMAERENGAHLTLGLILPPGDGDAKPR